MAVNYFIGSKISGGAPFQAFLILTSIMPQRLLVNLLVLILRNTSTHIRNTLLIAALVPVFRTDTSQILRQETHFSLFAVNGVLLDSVLVHDTFLNVPRLHCEILVT